MGEYCHARMNRRNFLIAFGAAISAVAADPDRLPWEPGKKPISIPRAGAQVVWLPLHRNSLIRLDQWASITFDWEDYEAAIALPPRPAA